MKDMHSDCYNKIFKGLRGERTKMWTKILPILPILVEGIITFICGIYQLAFRKESFLMCSYRKKYNYEKNRKKFVKMCGVLDIAAGIFLAVLLPILYLRASVGETLFVSVLFLCMILAGQRIMLWRYTDNLENRRK